MEARDLYTSDAVEVRYALERATQICAETHPGRSVVCWPCQQAAMDEESEYEAYLESLEVPAVCPVCSGAGYILGTLGNLTHYRCRYCGIDFQQKGV